MSARMKNLRIGVRREYTEPSRESRIGSRESRAGTLERWHRECGAGSIRREMILRFARNDRPPTGRADTPVTPTTVEKMVSRGISGWSRVRQPGGARGDFLAVARPAAPVRRAHAASFARSRSARDVARVAVVASEANQHQYWLATRLPSCCVDGDRACAAAARTLRAEDRVVLHRAETASGGVVDRRAPVRRQRFRGAGGIARYGKLSILYMPTLLRTQVPRTSP